ncbi:uncharacterized protein LOC132316077 isoform X2 [Cornus florida]|uniref:uncharacterized protein LOC132316077 isoform X2 n=1 Tax=Cornus florida TaxID=4283 RepID=UPI00289FBDF3|nr:uncharacterized protein LOC132316077 isoform X2 [Cornus florida]
MASTMEQSPLSTSTSRRRDEPEFNLREWALKSRISRENTRSRRFSASNIIRREDTRSFRSNITISSTPSSPGYSLKEIDPSTYSFTTALKALQARSVYSWECLSPDGFALNSKWNEAEKYICNPLSGEVPMECLSAKTLSGRLTSRLAMSAPLIYPSHSRLAHTNSSLTLHENDVHIPIQEKKEWSMNTRDVGTQSTPPDLSSSSSPSPASTPPIEERSIKRGDAVIGDSPFSNIAKTKSEEEVEVKVTGDKEETKSSEEEDQGEKAKQKGRCKQGGCLSWRSLWMRRRQRDKHKPRKKIIFCHQINGC